MNTAIGLFLILLAAYGAMSGISDALGLAVRRCEAKAEKLRRENVRRRVALRRRDATRPRRLVTVLLPSGLCLRPDSKNLPNLPGGYHPVESRFLEAWGGDEADSPGTKAKVKVQ